MSDDLFVKYENEIMPYEEFEKIPDESVKADLLRMWLKNFSVKKVRETWSMNSAKYYNLVNQLRVEKRDRGQFKRKATAERQKASDGDINSQKERERVIIDAEFSPVQEKSLAIKEPDNQHQAAPNNEPIIAFKVEDQSKNIHKRLQIIASLIEMEQEGRLRVNIEVYRA